MTWSYNRRTVCPDMTSQGQPACISVNKLYGAYKNVPVVFQSTQGTFILVEVSIVTPNTKAKHIYLHSQLNSVIPSFNCSFYWTHLNYKKKICMNFLGLLFINYYIRLILLNHNWVKSFERISGNISIL